MSKKNLKEQLVKRKIKKPNRLICFFTGKAFKHLAKKRNVTFQYLGDVKKYQKQQIILLSQHCSRDEYIYVIAGFPKYDYHCVIGYRNFFNKKLYPLLIRAGAIAKFLYQPDSTATKHMLRVVKNGESLVLFPEGIQSTSGSTHPINPATMKLLMKCRLPVVLCTSHGSYFTHPRYSDVKRIGKMTFTYQLLFSSEDYQNYSAEELYQRLLSQFRYNEFDYNKKARVPFVGKCHNIEGLDNIIYKCPHCNGEFGFEVNNDFMKCTNCGYQVRMDNYYDLQQVNYPLYFDDIDKWYKWQRKQVAKEVQQNFKMTAPVKVFDINAYKLKNQRDLVGEGVLTITNPMLIYKGTYYGQQTELQFDIKNIPSMPFVPSEHRLEMYVGNNYFCFEPQENPLQVVKWMLAAEEIHNLYDVHWAQASREVYDD